MAPAKTSGVFTQPPKERMAWAHRIARGRLLLDSPSEHPSRVVYITHQQSQLHHRRRPRSSSPSHTLTIERDNDEKDWLRQPHTARVCSHRAWHCG